MPGKFRAVTAHIEVLAKLLKSIRTVNEVVYVTMSPNGLWLQSVDNAKACTAALYLDTKFFVTYEISDAQADVESESETVLISLDALMYSLQMLVDWDLSSKKSGHGMGRSHKVVGDETGEKHTCTFTYEPGAPLQLLFNVGGVRSTCSFHLYDDDREQDDDGPILDQDDLLVQAILKGEAAYNVFRELESINTTTMVISATDRPAALIFIGQSDVANTRITLAASEDNKTGIETLVVEGRASHSYNFRLISKVKEALHLSTRASLRYDKTGVLNLQTMHTYGEHVGIVDFKFMPNGED